jgi:hypothetical protein
MLEAGLIYGCFMFMLVATLDIGHYMFLHQTLVERARSAARYGVARTFDASAIQNMVLYNSPTVPSGATPIFGLNTSNVSVTETAATLNTPAYLNLKVSGWRYIRLTPTQTGQPTGQNIRVMLQMELP